MASAALAFRTGGDARVELEVAPSQPLFQIQRGSEFPPFAQRTFPDDRVSPAGLEQVSAVSPVPLHVGIELVLPEFRACGRCGRVWAPVMSMPEAAVNETHRSESTKHQIGRAGEFSIMQSVSEAKCVESPPESQFGYSISAPDSRHHPGTSRLIHYVRHCRRAVPLSGKGVTGACSAAHFGEHFVSECQAGPRGAAVDPAAGNPAPVAGTRSRQKNGLGHCRSSTGSEG